MTDETGHQLPNITYPGLDRAELVDWVERFYGEYYFRPRVAWRIMRKAMFDSSERRRLYKEAREYLSFRQKRKKIRRESAGMIPSDLAAPAQDAVCSPVVVILSNVLGNFLLSLGLKTERLSLNPWVMLGVSLLILWMLSAHDSAELGGPDLRAAGDRSWIRADGTDGQALPGEQVSLARWAGIALIVGGVSLVGDTPIRTTAERASR